MFLLCSLLLYGSEYVVSGVAQFFLFFANISWKLATNTVSLALQHSSKISAQQRSRHIFTIRVCLSFLVYFSKNRSNSRLQNTCFLNTLANWIYILTRSFVDCWVVCWDKISSSTTCFYYRKRSSKQT